MTIIENPQQFRANVVTKLSDKFQQGEIQKCEKHEKLMRNIETCIYNYAVVEARSKDIIIKWENPMFVHIYLDRLRTIYMNMKNPDFLVQLNNEEVTPKTLESMTHQEMNAQRWAKLIDMKIKRKESRYDNKAVASTDMFTCRKCKSKKCTYYEMQTRSADEPSTIFVTCLDCGKNWRA